MGTKDDYFSITRHSQLAPNSDGTCGKLGHYLHRLR
jgi:hypothetical protein